MHFCLLGDSFFWAVLLICKRRSPNIWATFFHGKIYLCNNFGTILGEFFTNKSGHPAGAYLLLAFDFGAAAVRRKRSVTVGFRVTRLGEFSPIR
jgi:hypothetical protein